MLLDFIEQIDMCKFLTRQAVLSKISEMFHPDRMCQCHTLVVTEQVFSPLIMWHAADIVSASVWSLPCLVQLDLRDSCLSDPLGFKFLSRRLSQQFQGFLLTRIYLIWNNAMPLRTASLSDFG